jgi:diphthamide synthase subunit DPH2
MFLYRMTLLAKRASLVFTTEGTHFAEALHKVVRSEEYKNFMTEHPKTRILAERGVENGLWLPIWARPTIESYSRRLHKFIKRGVFHKFMRKVELG